jgi:hypothetical protein
VVALDAAPPAALPTSLRELTGNVDQSAALLASAAKAFAPTSSLPRSGDGLGTATPVCDTERVTSCVASVRPGTAPRTAFAGAWYICARDVTRLADPAVLRELRSADADMPAEATVSSLPPALPIEAGLSWLAAASSVRGVYTTSVGACAAAGAGSGRESASIPPALGSAVPASSAAPFAPAGAIRGLGYARVGLLGNPSDGYAGKTMAVTVGSPVTHVMLELRPRLRLFRGLGARREEECSAVCR